MLCMQPGNWSDMSDVLSNAIIDDAVAEALRLDLCFLSGSGLTRHVPFALTPAVMPAAEAEALEQVSPLLGRLTQILADDADLIQTLHAPLAPGDPFFAELLSIHRELHAHTSQPARVPLLLQRSDFMLDTRLGPRLVECNSIAAGMAPFGDRVQRLHRYLRDKWSEEILPFSQPSTGPTPSNPATDNMAKAIAVAAQHIRREHGDAGEPTFLMVIQEDEDNVFDQRLLEEALQVRGVRTFRRTFRQLHAQLGTGSNERLLLDGAEAIDVVYLRAGYLYQDYIATDLDTKRCCDALRATRIFIERHRVAVNATVGQQLATSKRMQQYLSTASHSLFSALGFSLEEAQSIAGVFAEMREVDGGSVAWLKEEGRVENWVLKNQGEGGGHCLFDRDIVPRLEAMRTEDYPTWSLMHRLRPRGRSVPTIAVRDGDGNAIDGLVSEVGMFTAHLEGNPLLQNTGQAPGYLGYLVRSKPPEVTEGGVHSGFGMLDSLVFSEEDS
jgi:glutathione synthetase